MKLWDKGFSTDKKIDIFTVGNDRELDLILAKYDVIGNLAAYRSKLGKTTILQCFNSIYFEGLAQIYSYSYFQNFQKRVWWKNQFLNP